MATQSKTVRAGKLHELCMKKLFTIACGVVSASMCVSADSATEYLERIQAGLQRNAAMHHCVGRFREVDGKVYDLLPFFAHITNGAPASRQDWVFLSGEILQTKAGGGVLVSAHDVTFYYSRMWYYDKSKRDPKTVWVKNFPLEAAVVDGSGFSAIVKRVGRHEYTSTSGAVSTVESYDYGTPIQNTDERVSLLLKRELDARSEMEMARSNVAKQFEAAESARRKKVNEATIANQMRNASNGFEYAQFELGIRYLKGDGVETNRALAMHWLKSACTNGSSRATNELQKLATNGQQF